MSLTGDAMAHAILPGTAAGFLLHGLEIVPMTISGLVAGIFVALRAGAGARLTVQKEDASMAVFAENISDARFIEQITSKAGLELGGTLYSDALSSAEGPSPRYIDMMHYNVETLANAINNG